MMVVFEAYQFDSIGEVYTIRDLDECKHISIVRRAKQGDEILVLNGKGSHLLGEIDSLAKNQISLRIRKKWRLEDKRSLSIYLGLPKKEYWEEVLRWSSLLQVKNVFGFQAERSQNFKRNIQREKKVLVEALKQSQGAYLPQVEILQERKDWSAVASKAVYLDCHGENSIKNSDLGAIESIFIGPEGGWTQKEKSLFQEDGIRHCRLPFGVLKTADVLPVAMSYIAACR